MRRFLPALAAALAPLLVVVGLSWPLVLHLGSWHMVTAWGDSHVWVMDWAARHLLQDPGALLGKTAEAGYPVPRDLRAVGGAALLLYLPLRLVLSPLAAGTLVHLLVFPVTALFTYAALGRLSRAGPWTRAALAAAFALGPTVLSTLGMGEISNTQAWVLPAFLLAADACCPLDTGRPLRPLRAGQVALVGLLGGLSSPYYTLALPLLAGGWALAAVLRRRAWLAGGLVVVALGLGMLPVGAYYGGGAAGGTDSLVNPAPRALQGSPVGPALPSPPPVATPDALLWARPKATLSPYEAVHVSYLGLPLLLAGLLAGRREAGRNLGAALLLTGLLLSLGPWLALGGRYLDLGGRPLALPVRLLEAVGYPTRQGGLYFRYAVVAELGLVVLVAAGLAGRRRAALFAWGLLLLQTGDAVRATMPRWPLQVEPVADQAALEAMAPPPGSGVMAADGAVLELPLQGPTDGLFGQASVLRALFHRRPTTGLLRDVRLHERGVRPILDRARRDPAHLAEDLRAAGFRYVLLPRELARFSQPDEASLRRLLGPPGQDGELLIWDLGPTSLVVQAP